MCGVSVILVVCPKPHRLLPCARSVAYNEGKHAEAVCCSKRLCSRKYDVASVRGIRHYVSSLTRTQQREFCKSRIITNPDLASRHRSYFLEEPAIAADCRQDLTVAARPINNLAVCAKFFTFATGKSLNFVYQPNQPGTQMRVDIETIIDRATPKEDAVVIFMRDISRFYQLSPDDDCVYLPFPKRKVVHQIYMEQGPPQHRCHMQYFCKVWRSNPLITHIKLRKHLRFALCDTCVEFREMQLVKKTTAERWELKRAQLGHHMSVKKERQMYYWRRDLGISEEHDSVSMIVDAADQSKYALPYLHVASHSSQACLRVPVHLMGVLVHGDMVRGYTYYENFLQGHNVTIQAIHNTLADKLARDGKLPSTLYLQLDNTTKQCKGRYIIGWLGYLIHVGRFRHTVLSFLPVGHTHEDIDQIFSRLSVYLKCHNAINMEQLHEAIRAVIKRRTVSVRLAHCGTAVPTSPTGSSRTSICTLESPSFVSSGSTSRMAVFKCRPVQTHPRPLNGQVSEDRMPPPTSSKRHHQCGWSTCHRHSDGSCYHTSRVCSRRSPC